MQWMSLRNRFRKTHTVLAFLVLSSLLVSSYFYCCRDAHEITASVTKIETAVEAAEIETASAMSHECCNLVADFDLAWKAAQAPCHCLHDAEPAALQSAATLSPEMLSALVMQDRASQATPPPWLNVPALVLIGSDFSASSNSWTSSSPLLGGINAQPVFLRTLRLLV